MFTILSTVDQQLMENILYNRNLDEDYSPDINLLILNKITSEVSDNNSTLHKNIKVLKQKFNFLYNENMTLVDTILCNKIAEFIIIKFLNNDYKTVPQNLFCDNFMNFLIDSNLLFKKYFYSRNQISVFRKLTSREDNYFNIKYKNKLYENYYIYAVDLKIFIKNQLLTYVILNKYEINITFNFIHLMYNVVSIPNVDKLSIVVYDLFILLYTSLSNMLLINENSYKFYEKIYAIDTENIKNLLKFTKLILGRLHEFDMFKRLLHIALEDFTHESYTEDILDQVIYNYLYETTLVADIENYRKDIKPELIHILTNENTNIHTKNNILFKLNTFDSDFIVPLKQLFIDMEKYREEQGFTNKIKARSKILRLIALHYDETFEGNFNNDTFISFYTNHINSIFSKINDIFRGFLSEKNKMFLYKYLLYLESSIDFIKILYNICGKDEQSIFFFKIAEVYYNIFKVLLESGLYADFTITINESYAKIIPEAFADSFQLIFIKIFSNLHRLTTNKFFIKNVAINNFFYDKKALVTSKEKYGEFLVNNANKLSDVIDTFITNINNEIEIIKTGEITFDEDIPDKFLDPIMCTPINNPIMIPSVEQVVDKYTIYNHLIFNETNPFTNEVLTILELERYNLEKNIIEKINKFKEYFEIWKSDHKN